MKDNFQYTFTTFLKLIKARVTTTSAVSYLESHPDQESMWAYSQALSQFKIENIAIKASIEDIGTLPTPFITYFEKDGGKFLTVKSTENGIVEWLDTQKGWIRSQYSDFVKDWSGIVLLVEVHKNSGEVDYPNKRRLENLQSLRIPLAIIMSIISMLFFIAPSLIDLHVRVNVLILVKILGMFLALMLFFNSINLNKSLLNKLCPVDSKVSCQNILSGPAARVTTWLSWSDLGFIYFFGSFFSLALMLGFNNELTNYLGFQMFISTLNLSFCFYSIYYQSAIAHSLCVLCLGVVMVFILEFVVLLFFPFHFSPNLEFVKRLFIGFSGPAIFLLFFKESLSDSVEYLRNKKELAKIKSNPDVFNALISKQKELSEVPTAMPVIEIGNPKAKHTLTIVSNPLCTPCAKVHEKIENLLKENEHVKCQVIFLSVTDEENEGGKFIRKLFSLPEQLHQKALNEWFTRNDKNYEAWNKNYTNHPTVNDSIIFQKNHNRWISHTGIKATPSVFINKRLLPQVISIDDLGPYLAHFDQEHVIT